MSMSMLSRFGLKLSNCNFFSQKIKMAPIFFLACFSKSSRIRQKLKMQKFLHILEEQTKKNKKLLQKKKSKWPQIQDGYQN
jgi:uncharacterized protein YacL